MNVGVAVFDYLDARPGQVVFIDDAEPNTDGAARLGIHTILHTDPDSTAGKLARLVTTPVPRTSQRTCCAQHKENP